MEKVVSHFGKLLSWFSPREPLSGVLVQVLVMSPSVVPKDFVMRQMGGQRRSWTVPVFILRTDGANVFEHNVPLASEDPLPPNGDAHPLFGPHTIADQAFQVRLQAWLVRNGVFGPG